MSKTDEIEQEANTRLDHALKRLARPRVARQQVSSQPTRATVQSPITRARCLRRIRYLVDTYQVDWILAQWVELLGPLKSLDNHELLSVLADLDMAYDCIREGIPLEEVFLDPQSDGERLAQRAAAMGIVQTN